MTTYTLTGLSVDFTNDKPSRLGTATLTAVVTDNFRFAYEKLSPGDNDSAAINLSPARGDAYGLSLNGHPVDQNYMEIFEVSWGNKTGQFININSDNSADVVNIFHLAGDDFPSFKSATEFTNFATSVSGQNGTLSGTFAAGNPFSLSDIAALSATTQNDVLIADVRFDDWSDTVISTGRGNDRVEGIGFAETFRLGSGNDIGKGGGGNDKIIGGSGNDKIWGNIGNDILRGNGGDDRILGGASVDVIKGDAGRDMLDGGSGRDTIFGGNQNDTLKGGTGNDKLSGGKGNDMISGGGGNDTLSGNGGKDTFIFKQGFGFDRVVDFADNQDTLIFKGKFGYASVEELLTHAIDAGPDVLFGLGANGSLVVSGITKADLADDILFG